MSAQDNFFKKALLLGVAGATALGGLAMGSKMHKGLSERPAAVVVDQSRGYWNQLQSARNSLRSAEDGVLLKTLSSRVKADLIRVAASETDRFVRQVSGKNVDSEHLMLVISGIDDLFLATANYLAPEGMRLTAASRSNLQRDRAILASKVR